MRSKVLPAFRRPKGPLKQAKGGDDGGLGDVPLGHGDLVVPLDKAQLGEVAATVQPIGEVVDVGHRVQ